VASSKIFDFANEADNSILYDRVRRWWGELVGWGLDGSGVGVGWGVG
jgi:hypothetical protein